MINLRPHQDKCFDAMQINNVGQVIVPTGGGKTYIMIEDAINQFKSPVTNTIVVVAPRILLANQLCAEFTEFITDTEVAHVHSGETHHYSTTKASRISVWATKNCAYNQIIFTTYHPLSTILCNE